MVRPLAHCYAYALELLYLKNLNTLILIFRRLQWGHSCIWIFIELVLPWE